MTSGGLDNPVTDVLISKSTIELKLKKVIYADEVVTVTYTDTSNSDDINALQDLAGNDAESFKSASVVNHSTVTLSKANPANKQQNSAKASTQGTINAENAAASNLVNKKTNSNNALTSGNDAEVSTSLLLNEDNSFDIKASQGKGLWLNLNVKSASTVLQNSLLVVDQNGLTLGSIGATQYSKNCGKQAIFIPEGSTISFHQHSNNQAVNSAPLITITEQSDGSFKLMLNDGVYDSDNDDLIIDISASTIPINPESAALAAKQKGINNTIIDLSTISDSGQTLKLTLKSDCEFKNQIAMVKLKEEADSSFSVDGVANTAGEAFDQAVQDNLIHPAGTIITATGVEEQTIEWSLSAADSGLYAPVLINPDGEIFTSGSKHVKSLGINFFAFEDDHSDSNSDWDYNDLSILFEVI